MSDATSKADALKRIKSGKGIQYVLDKSYEIFGNPLVIFDMEYKLIANSDGMPPDDPFCADFINYGMLSDELIRFSMDESFIDSVSYSAGHDGIAYLISENLEYDRIFGQLYDKKRMPVADLVAVASNSPFDDDAPKLVKIICRLLSKELSGSPEYEGYGQIYQEGIIKKLIEGGIEEKGVYAAHVANIDAGLKNYIFMAVAHSTRCSGDYGELSELREALKREYPELKYFAYSDNIVILISVNKPVRSIDKKLARLGAVFAQHDIYAGVSRAFENLFELSAYYAEALEALKAGLEVRAGTNDGGRVFFAQSVKRDGI